MGPEDAAQGIIALTGHESIAIAALASMCLLLVAFLIMLWRQNTKLQADLMDMAKENVAAFTDFNSTIKGLKTLIEGFIGRGS